MVYLTTLSLSETISHQMALLLINPLKPPRERQREKEIGRIDEE
jgi:hypothetical protein